MKTKTITSKSSFERAKNLILILTIGFFTFSCSSDDGFEDANGNAAKKYITKIIAQTGNEITVSKVVYNNEGRVVSASLGDDTRYFSYNDNGRLEKVAGGGENIFTSEVISEIYDIYEIGDVLEFDQKGNPTVLKLYDTDFYGNQITNMAYLTYDEKPFAYYYTMDAAGIIDVLYDVRFRFIAPPEIVMAKKLLPVNNPVKAIIKNNSDQEIRSISVNYIYDENNYPKTASVVSIDDEGYAESYDLTYEYR